MQQAEGLPHPWPMPGGAGTHANPLRRLQPPQVTPLLLPLPQVMEGMAAAQEALQLLIPAGDYAGALDILYDLSSSGAPMAVAALHAFRDLPLQLTQAAEVLAQAACFPDNPGSASCRAVK